MKRAPSSPVCLVLNLANYGRNQRCSRTAQEKSALTTPSILSKGTHIYGEVLGWGTRPQFQREGWDSRGSIGISANSPPSAVVTQSRDAGVKR